MQPCLFSGCSNLAVPGTDKCSFHKARKVCQVAYCCNIVYARGKCVRHGGRKKCQYPQCTASAHRGDLCYNHGGTMVKRLCTVEGCKTQAHARRLCVRHGGGRQCTFDSCTRHAKVSGFCGQHRPVNKAIKTPTVVELPSTETIMYAPVYEQEDWCYLDSLILDSVLDDVCEQKEKIEHYYFETPILERRVFIS